MKQWKSVAHHGFRLGIEGSNEIRDFILLEPNPRVKRMSRIVLENAASGVINQDQPSLTAHIGQAQGSDHIGSNGLDLMRFTPVDVRAAGDSSGVEDMGGLDGGDISLEGGAVLETARAISEIDTLLLAELAKQTANPAGPAVNQELERRTWPTVSENPHGWWQKEQDWLRIEEEEIQRKLEEIYILDPRNWTNSSIWILRIHIYTHSEKKKIIYELN